MLLIIKLCSTEPRAQHQIILDYMKNNPVPVMLNTICELYPVNEIPKFSSEADTDQMEQQT